MSTNEDSNQPRVLVVDDDSDVRFMLHRYLRCHGFGVEVAKDGARLRELIGERTSTWWCWISTCLARPSVEPVISMWIVTAKG